MELELQPHVFICFSPSPPFFPLFSSLFGPILSFQTPCGSGDYVKKSAHPVKGQCLFYRDRASSY